MEVLESKKETNIERADSILPLVGLYANIKNREEIQTEDVPVIIQDIVRAMMHYYVQYGVGDFDKTLREARYKFIRQVDDEIDESMDADIEAFGDLRDEINDILPV